MMTTQTTTTMNTTTQKGKTARKGNAPKAEEARKPGTVRKEAQTAAAAAAAKAAAQARHRRQLHHPYRPPTHRRDRYRTAAKAVATVSPVTETTTATKAKAAKSTKATAGGAKVKAGWAAGAACRARDVRNARKALLAPPSFLEWVDPSRFKGKKGHRALGTARVLAQGAGGGVGGGGGASSPDLSLRSCPSLSAGADAAYAKAVAEEQAGFPTALGCGDAVEAMEGATFGPSVEAVETKEEVAEAVALPASPRRAVRGQGEAGEAAPTKAAPTKAKAVPTKAAAAAAVPVAKVTKATEKSVEKPAKLSFLLDLFFKGVLNATEFAEQKARLAA